MPEFCVKCGNKLTEDESFCPKCGAPMRVAAPTQPAQPYQPTPQSNSNKVWGIDKRIIVVVVVFLVLIVPVFPRDKVIYVDGSTQTMTMSTSYITSVQRYATQSEISINVYKGTLNTVSDTYYNSYSNYWYGNYNNGCYYSDYYGGWVCGNYNYSYWPYYGQSQYGYNTVTVDPSDNIVKIHQTQESNGLWTMVLTHYDGTTDTYRHVYQMDLTRTGTSTVQGSVTASNTITNSAITPVTFSVPCQACIPQHVTEHVSLLQLLFGF
ncbi:MAG: zinc ribbon domain-containing protein [Candidatus Bathyarchaeia archaeon]|jgi:hypothetical protein